MTAEQRSVGYGTQVIDFSIIRRNRITLEIAVESDASVRVVAPFDATPETIDAKVRKRAAWIKRQQRFFKLFLPRTPERRFVGGETHLYLGRQHRLKIRKGEQEGVKLARGFIIVTLRDPESSRRVELLIDQWYRERAYLKFAERLEASLGRFSDPGSYRPKRLSIRKMKQRWGSMSVRGQLLLNLRLIEAPSNAIDYVITHELCHVKENNHGPRFHALLSKVMPDWQKRKERLERILA